MCDALWNSVISVANSTQQHDTAALLDFLYHLKLKDGDSKLSIKRWRRDTYNMHAEHRVFNRTPDTEETLTITLGQLIDIVSAAIPVALGGRV